MTIQDKLIKIDTKVILLTEDPQEQIINILLGNILLNQSGYNSGTLSLTSITSGSSGTASVDDLFLLNAVLHETLTDSCNTAIIMSEYPFDLQINDGYVQKDLYHFSLVSDTHFAIAVANRSEENDVTLRYLLAAASSLGSSYVYT